VAMAAPILSELYAAGQGLEAIADSLAAEHIQTPRGGQWRPSSVRAGLIPGCLKGGLMIRSGGYDIGLPSKISGRGWA
jgi:recombinase